MKSIATLLSRLTLFLLLTPLAAQAQAPAWQSALAFVSRNSPGFSTNTEVTATAADASGNVYVAGNYSGNLTLGATTLTNFDGFLAKWSRASSSFVWAQRVDGDIKAIAINGSSVYLTGYFYESTASFGTTTLTNYDQANFTYDVFIAKLTDAGSSASFNWARQVGSPADDYVNSLAVSGTSVYVTGQFKGTAALFGSTTLTNAGPASTSDVFVTKLTDAGSTSTFSWTQRAGGAGNDEAYGVAVSGANVYIAGGATGTATFGSLSFTSAGQVDMFVAKLADAGGSSSYSWVQRAGGAGSTTQTVATALAVMGSTLYVAGGFVGPSTTVGATTLTNAGDVDGFVTKLTDAGSTASFGWAQQLGGTNFDVPYALAVNKNSVYLAGVFNLVPYVYTGPGSATFGSTTLTSAGAGDAFVARLLDAGTTGSFVWAQRAGGPNDDFAQSLLLSGTTVYVGGYFEGTTSTFGSFTLTNNNPNSSTTSLNRAGFLASLTDLALPTRDAALAENLALYPNPAHGTVTVRVPAGAAATLTLLDALGRVARTAAAPAGPAYPLDLTCLAPGVYALRVQASEASAVRRLVVE